MPDCRLLAGWPAGAEEPSDYWLSTMPAETPPAELLRWTKIRWHVEYDCRELEHGPGLDHFESRTWTGWHHHATLVTVAHVFTATLNLMLNP